MDVDLTDVAGAKARLRASVPDPAELFREIGDALGREAEGIARRRAEGDPVVPSVAFADVAAGRVPGETVAAIRAHGCAIVRGVFPRAQAEAWDRALLDYVQANDYVAHAKEKAGLDKYFSQLKSGRPQIYGIYWSKPQMEARQGETLAVTRAWLNGLWSHGATAEFAGDRECTYADRIRQREPGDDTLGLSAHMDGGSVERWTDPGYNHVYRHVLSGDWRRYDPWAAEGRTGTHEIPSPAVCRMFRTYQGWTALTSQGPGDGTLQLLPMPRAIIYMLLRALQDDVPAGELCGAQPARALRATEQWHAPLMRAMVPLPRVEPGDTVWWHPDVIHAVEDHNRGAGYSSVIYIGSAPDCAKNRAYLPPQREAFLAGRSAPDFAAEDYEVAFTGRATEADLSALGRRQMGFDAW